MDSMMQLSKQILKEYIRHMKERDSIFEYVEANYNFIPINCRFKVPRSVVFTDIAESLRLTLHTINYKLIMEVLETLGVRGIQSNG